MARLRRNEWNFAANTAQHITQVLQGPQYAQSPLGHAEPELTEFRGARRLDLVIFDRDNRVEPLVTAELKLPWRADGRNPYDSRLVEGAHGKAVRAGATYFITWNLRRLVVWKTDDPGVELLQRVVYDLEVIPFRLTRPEDLDRPDVRTRWQNAVERLIGFLHSVFTGPPEPVYLPLDQVFIARLETALYDPVDLTTDELIRLTERPSQFKRRLEAWMRERQGWVVSAQTRLENLERAARFTSYMLVNRLCFYNALRRKYTDLRRLTVANNIRSGDQLRRRLDRAFGEAERFTGDYETVFEGEFGDSIPFVSDAAVRTWRQLIRALDRYDFATIPLDIIGAMYERLIAPEERHRFGQHYTQPSVVDLIESFALRNGQASVLDPACGGGTFLVRAYARKRVLDNSQDHADLLVRIYGCDILDYACHLSTVNLAIRDLIDDDNFPRIHHGDFLTLTPGSTFCQHPIRLQAGGLPTGTQTTTIERSAFDAIVGNPPYIDSREIPSANRGRYFESVTDRWPMYPWRRDSNIYVYFWTHSEQFLRDGGTLALLTQSSWLDVEYGIAVQQWMLDNFRIICVIESEVEPWFTDARVATAVTVLQRETDAARADQNIVRFVQFRRKLGTAIGSNGDSSEEEQQRRTEQLRDTILATRRDAITDNCRVRVVRQNELREVGLEGETYVGATWGRYLRSTDELYRIQQRHNAMFCRLVDLAEIDRGITTNCDDFFIVTDASVDALQRHRDARAFRGRFGVPRSQIATGKMKIIRRSDNVEFGIESRFLVPILPTARGLVAFDTSEVDSRSLVVLLPEGRKHLSRLAAAYVQAGEQERWHERPSFTAIVEAGGAWWHLRETEVAPILLNKAMQYIPMVFWNGGGYVANQRLYRIRPNDGVNPRALFAILNSTVFAAERYASVKAMGREALIEVEVFSARRFLVPDVRRYSVEAIAELEALGTQLCGREAGPMLEGSLLETGSHEAVAYAASHTVDESRWPVELNDTTRQAIDQIVLSGVGVRQAERSRRRLYTELTEHTRKLKILELEAQINRRRQAGTGPGASELADEIWAELVGALGIEPRHVPIDFIDEGVDTEEFEIPSSRARIEEPGLFAGADVFPCRFGRQVVEFASEGQRQYVVTLSQHGIHGTVPLPTDPTQASQVETEVQAYLDDLDQRLRDAACEITNDASLQDRIVREGMKRIAPR